MLFRANLFQVRKPLLALVARSTSTSATSNASAVTSAPPSEVGFQRPVRGDQAPVRFGFVPEEWFTFFYKKTGVTGPYIFGFSVFTYLASKEIYVMEHEFYTGISLALLLTYGVKTYGPDVKKYLDGEIDKLEASMEQNRKDEIVAHEESIKNEKIEQWRSEGQLLLNDAQKENVLLQLEAAYRARLATVFHEVKRRLDYQLEIQRVQRTVKQKHLVNWVTSKVLASITQDQDQQTLNKCIADLKALAPN